MVFGSLGSLILCSTGGMDWHAAMLAAIKDRSTQQGVIGDVCSVYEGFLVIWFLSPKCVLGLRVQSSTGRTGNSG
jgi:hypothetical protein